MRILALLLQCLASLVQLLPTRKRIAFLSRQSSKPSLDYRILINELRKNGKLHDSAIVLCLTEPETKSKNIASFALGTLKQLYLANTSKVVIVDGYVPAVSIPKKNKANTVIQLWHSLGAIKKFGYQCLDTPAGRSKHDAEIAHMHENYDYIIAGGPGAITAFAEAFNYPPSQILPLGLPRIDYLLDPDPKSARRKKADQVKKHYDFFKNGNRNILYAPTLRKGPGYDNWLTDSLYALTEYYSVKYGNQFNLIVAGHPLNLGFDRELLRQYPLLHFIPGAATIDLLELADEVVSDYSGVILEAGLLDKKLDFYLPDYDQYKISPGLNIEPKSLNPETVKEYLGNPTFGITRNIAQFVLEKLND